MSSALFAASWYRVATLKPRLRTQADISRHVYRGELWFVLQDLASGRFLRFNPAAYQLISLMDGQRTMADIWERVIAAYGDDAPTQDEVLNLLSQLHQANVLLTDCRPDLEELDTRRKKAQLMKFKQYFSNPLALKFPLLDPDRWLGRVVDSVPKGSGYFLLFLWFALVTSGAVMAAMHWGELTRDVTSRVFTLENMLLMWLAFPLVKAAHELGHGLVIKAFGGQCHEMGLMFLVLVPIPYVDASQVVAFPNKYQRIVVSMAGMMVELAIAAIAIWLWSGAAVGPMKAFLYQIIILAGVTTLFFNLNPLLRFDGYYALADWLEIPNLGNKANKYIGYLCTRYLFGVVRGNEPPRMTAREPAWLLGYGVLSFAYRMFVMFAILILVGGQFFFIGVLLAIWAAYAMGMKPLGKIIKFVFSDQLLEGKRQRAFAVSGALLAGLVLMLVLLPVSSGTSTEGVIWMPGQSQVRAPVSCFAESVLVEAGQEVREGQVLLECSEPSLVAEYEHQQARLLELRARLDAAVFMGRVAEQIIERELLHTEQQVAGITAKLAAMRIASPHDGTFVMSSPADFKGHYLERGTVLAYVLDPDRFTLLTVVPQGRVDLVRRSTLRVELRSVGRVHELIPARIAREVPGATNDLPSLALSLAGGGGIGLNPDAPEQSPQALSSLFQFEIEFDTERLPNQLGSRVFVRFVHHPEPLLVQWYRSLRQVFIKHFSV